MSSIAFLPAPFLLVLSVQKDDFFLCFPKYHKDRSSAGVFLGDKARKVGLMRFNKPKCEVLYLAQGNPRHK